MISDLRFALRMIRKNPGFTVLGVLALALGIGINAAIFSIVNALMIRPLPIRDAERIVIPATVFRRHNTDRGSVSYPDFLDWKSRGDLFEAVALMGTGPLDISGGEAPERIRGAQVTEDYFRVTGSEPLLGRTFLPEENTAPANRVVVLSYGLWMRRFGGDRGVLGRKINLSDVPHEIVGVTPRDSQWPQGIELWQPLGFGTSPPQWVLRRDNHVWRAVARLRPGVTLEQAQAQLDVRARQVEKEFANRSGTGWKLHPLRRWIVYPELRLALAALFGAVGFVLLIACVNVANMLLARGAAREREIAVRAALGAGWPRIVRQLLTESLLLASAGGAAGAFIAWWGVQFLVRLAPPELPGTDRVGVDPILLGYIVALSFATAVAFGLIPAFQAARLSPAESFREGGRGLAGGIRGRRLRRLLVVAEMTLTIVLLAGAGFMIRSFAEMHSVDPGFQTHDRLTLQINLPGTRYSRPEQVASAYEQISDGIRRLPGVSAVAATSSLPLNGGGFYLGRVFLTSGQPEPPAGKDVSAMWSVVQPGYFKTMGMPLLAGRDFTDRDRQGSLPVMIISESMAKQVFPYENPIGKKLRSWRDENIYREVVGVVRDIRYWGLTEGVGNLVYVPLRQDAWSSMVLVIHTQGNPDPLLASIRGGIWSYDPRLALAEMRTMDEVLSRSLAIPRFILVLLAVFAAVALILAAVGLYGVMSYAVARRTYEIGIRMALGAQTNGVMRDVLGEGIVLALAGAAIGLAASAMLQPVLASLLYGVRPADPITFGAVLCLLLGVTLAACYFPARRATKVDPLIALRSE